MATSPTPTSRRFGLFRGSSIRKKDLIAFLQQKLKEKDEEISQLKTQNNETNDILKNIYEDLKGNLYHIVGDNVVVGDNTTIYDQRKQDGEVATKVDRLVKKIKYEFKVLTKTQAEMTLELQRTKSALLELQNGITLLNENSKDVKTMIATIKEKIGEKYIQQGAEKVDWIENGIKGLKELEKKSIPMNKVKTIKFTDLPDRSKPFIRRLKYKYGFHLKQFGDKFNIQQVSMEESSAATEDIITRVMVLWYTVNGGNPQLADTLKTTINELDKQILEEEEIRIVKEVKSGSEGPDALRVIEMGEEKNQIQVLFEMSQRMKELHEGQGRANEEMKKILFEGMATMFEKFEEHDVNCKSTQMPVIDHCTEEETTPERSL